MHQITRVRAPGSRFFKTALVCSALFLSVVMAGCASTPKKPENSEPVWVANPRTVYDEKQYVSAVGFGLTRELAEKSAFSSLVAVFGQRVQGETTVNERFSEALRNGALTVSEDSELNKQITTSVDLDTLVGAEIKDTWFDGKKTTYAVAVMDKAKGAMLYANMIEKNEETIAQLIDIPGSDRDSLDAYARYDLASAIGFTNERFLNVLSVLNPAAAAAKRASVTGGDSLKIECLRIAQNIPISVTVSNDRDGRISSVFETVISASGFKTGGDDSRYALEARLTLSPVTLADNENKFVRYIVDARLVDRAKGTVLIPFSINGREGHANEGEAENRAVRVAQQKIGTAFGKEFGAYLVQLTAGK